MERIVQFSIGIDDSKIEDIIINKSSNMIAKDLRNKIFYGGYYNRDATENDPLSEFSKEILSDFLKANRDVIIEKASQYLAQRLCHAKAAKEALNDVLKEK